MSRAVKTPEPDYEAIGVKVDGEYRQLNANLLQIENEYYSPVRPKRVANSGEHPTAALRRGGIEYVEIRSLDTSLMDPCGISQNTMRFVEAFLIYCLLEESPPFDTAALAEAADNQKRTARSGRDPQLELARNGEMVALGAWAGEVLERTAVVAATLDRHDGNDSYTAAVAEMQARVDDVENTPSARIVRELESSGRSFFEFALGVSQHHKDYFAAIAGLEADVRDRFEAEAAASLQRQADIEAADRIGLDEYLEQYFAVD